MAARSLLIWLFLICWGLLWASACGSLGAPPATDDGAACATGTAAAAIEARVVRVVDGDTIWVEMPDGSEEKVRYIGIDAPEVARDGAAGGYLGDEATAHNSLLVSSGRVRLETDVDERDDFGRLLAYVWSDGIFVNLQMVRDGYARAHDYPPNLAHQDQLRQAGTEARNAKRGVWNKE